MLNSADVGAPEGAEDGASVIMIGGGTGSLWKPRTKTITRMINTQAPPIAGIASKNENVAADPGASPNRAPVEIVIPLRERPGKIAAAWLSPITKKPRIFDSIKIPWTLQDVWESSKKTNTEINCPEICAVFWGE